ncbi:MAG: hypothetical protein ACJAT7_000172 [Psychromonas sp.]|jgi:hypothetical protein|uniref:hypothetical protein n=1 Tax=Psychromonas sp. TaxID=1884585 RepID=UPI0039E56A52
MKLSLNIFLIISLIFIGVFSAQAELATDPSMSAIESCISNDNENTDKNTNNCCSTASVLSFADQQLNYLNETLFFARLDFFDYKRDRLSQHSSRLFRPPIIHVLT